MFGLRAMEGLSEETSVVLLVPGLTFWVSELPLVLKLVSPV